MNSEETIYGTRLPVSREVKSSSAPLIVRITAFTYGLACYVVFFATLLWAVAFLGNIVVPKSIDAGPQQSLWTALLIDVGLLGLFAVQHSVMARQWFKRAWTRIVPGGG